MEYYCAGCGLSVELGMGLNDGRNGLVYHHSCLPKKIEVKPLIFKAKRGKDKVPRKRRRVGAYCKYTFEDDLRALEAELDMINYPQHQIVRHT